MTVHRKKQGTVFIQNDLSIRVPLRVVQQVPASAHASAAGQEWRTRNRREIASSVIHQRNHAILPCVRDVGIDIDQILMRLRWNDATHDQNCQSKLESGTKCT